MSSIDNILTFIEISGSSPSKFEKEVGLPNATLSNSKAREGGLSSSNIDKISKKYWKELKAKGFEIIDISPFENEIWAVLNKDEVKAWIAKRNLISSQSETAAQEIQEEAFVYENSQNEPPYLRELLESNKQQIAFLQRTIDSGLAGIIGEYSDLAALIQGSVRRAAELYAANDPVLAEKELEIIWHYAEEAKRANDIKDNKL